MAKDASRACRSSTNKAVAERCLRQHPHCNRPEQGPARVKRLRPQRLHANHFVMAEHALEVITPNLNVLGLEL